MILVELNQILIVIVLFRLICHQTSFCLVVDRAENCGCSLNFFRFMLRNSGQIFCVLYNLGVRILHSIYAEHLQPSSLFLWTSIIRSYFYDALFYFFYLCTCLSSASLYLHLWYTLREMDFWFLSSWGERNRWCYFPLGCEPNEIPLVHNQGNISFHDVLVRDEIYFFGKEINLVASEFFLSYVK